MFGLSGIAIKLGAVLLAGVAAAGGGWYLNSSAYSRGFAAASAQYQSTALEAALEAAQKQIRDQQEVIAEDRALAEQQAVEIAALKEKANVTLPNDAPCLDAGAADDIDRVR